MVSTLINERWLQAERDLLYFEQTLASDML